MNSGKEKGNAFVYIDKYGRIKFGSVKEEFSKDYYQ